MLDEQFETKTDNSEPDAIDLRLATLLIESPAATDQDLADKVGVSRQTINRRKNGPAVEQLIRNSLALPEREMRRVTAKALSRIEELLDHEDPKIKLAATVALLRINSRFMGETLAVGFW